MCSVGASVRRTGRVALALPMNSVGTKVSSVTLTLAARPCSSSGLAGARDMGVGPGPSVGHPLGREDLRAGQGHAVTK